VLIPQSQPVQRNVLGIVMPVELKPAMICPPLSSPTIHAKQ